LVFSRIKHERDGEISTGIEKSYGQTTIKYNGNKIKTVSEQSRGVPVILINQDSQLLLTGGPRERRHWLDWAMFHVEPEYLDVWKAYMKALRQRNMLLKRGVNKRELYRAWEQAMIESGRYLVEKRSRFLARLVEALNPTAQQVFFNQVSVILSSDWPENVQESDKYSQSWGVDLKNGYTRQGAHNIDIRFLINDKNLADFFSRGQTKLFICLLMIAQAKVLTEKTGVKPLLLLDDYRAELDEPACVFLLETLSAGETQALLTNTEEQNTIINKELQKTFHVEQGRIRAKE
jgi:DNA replication and repair protein RecF